MTTGDKIAAARKKSNLTQDALADIMEVTRQTVSRWESDIAYPEVDKLVKLCRILSINCDYLLKDDVTEDGAKIVNNTVITQGKPTIQPNEVIEIVFGFIALIGGIIMLVAGIIIYIVSSLDSNMGVLGMVLFYTLLLFGILCTIIGAALLVSLAKKNKQPDSPPGNDPENIVN